MKTLSLQKISKEEEKKIVETMIKFGLNPRYKGFVMLRDCLVLMQQNDDVGHDICLSTQVFPMLAEKYDTLASDVERNIRFLINRTINDVPISSLRKSLGDIVVNAMTNSKMSVKNYIKIIVEYIKYF